MKPEFKQFLITFSGSIISTCTIVFFFFLLLYSHNKIGEPIKESFTITISIFSALATIGATVIALKLYTDWRDPIRLQNKFEFHKVSKEIFKEFWMKASEYIMADLDIRVKITSENLEKNNKAAVEFNRCFYSLQSILNECDLYFNQNEKIPLKKMKDLLDSFNKEMKNSLPLEIKENDDNYVDFKYIEQHRRQVESLARCQEFYSNNFLTEILSELKEETR
ncbi:hypothetical protein [Acinetobacter baumannii]|uniref:hypothetical protein n=1 Tax=Acinetobacter baumannii TaxID=470 RepID=UPI00280F0B5B|nr:hypothetical protein [Acinetobacter baumannii]MDQ8919197.1 hypothetical protein [Acinetobacter baumannii]MDQ8950150.1 hypothetical protein [Acinetobacter baumannii]MDQ8968105.1 hypothetical protein [Acinetobacter baumannii]MDQ8982011.1 hypothetical protein [Acinetobacter baumannii]MDQ8989531.1 hypothetical protein [Acinetobacter baumannii]